MWRGMREEEERRERALEKRVGEREVVSARGVEAWKEEEEGEEVVKREKKKRRRQ